MLLRVDRGRRKSALSIHQLGPPDTALAVQACRVCENRDGRSTRSVASVSPSLWHALLQFRPLVAIPARIPSVPRYRVRMARISAWWRNGGETSFCAVCWPARGCVRRLPSRTRSICNSSSRGVAALFACALFLAAGFGEPDPDTSSGRPSNWGGSSLIAVRCLRKSSSFATVMEFAAPPRFSLGYDVRNKCGRIPGLLQFHIPYHVARNL